MPLALAISPSGLLFWDEIEDHKAGETIPENHAPSFRGKTFVQAIVNLAKNDDASSGAAVKELPAAVYFWLDFAKLYFEKLCHVSRGPVPPPSDSSLADRILELPPMKGREFATVSSLTKLWEKMDYAVQVELKKANGVEGYLEGTRWHQVGRVTFHLAENKRDETNPFAFLATYTSGLASEAEKQVQHIPLGRAIQQYAGENNKGTLLKLLQPVQAAAQQSSLIGEMVRSRAIYQPQAWSIQKAYSFLKEVPVLEKSGVVVRVPDWWKNAPRPQVSVTMGKKETQVGAEALLDFDVALTLGGETLSDAEWKQISNASHGLAYLRGRWVEVDKTRLDEALAHWKQLQNNSEGLGFLEGMRLLAGTSMGKEDERFNASESADWIRIQAGPWLTKTLEEMRSPTIGTSLDAIPGLKAQLRPYQKKGVSWLWLMQRLGLGACLADDMGLGKTIQVLSFLLTMKNKGQKLKPSLLVAPASLLANWQAEAARFTPSLKLWLAHPSNPAFTNKSPVPDGIHLALTTYGMLGRENAFLDQDWFLAILDEAQAIKNPASIQTRAAKKLKSKVRFALTGTPVENGLADLWSLFDFICPGLLGSANDFRNYCKRLAKEQHHFAPLRNLTQPYILRRLKTDKSIISDLPDKTELKAFCTLSKKQGVLYMQSVDELAHLLKTVESMKRRGLILSFLSRFKQICNHPDHWAGNGAFKPSESGKFERLGEITSQIAERQEKVLVFTQFKEMTVPLSRYLQTVFRRPGLVLHGQTTLQKRKEMVVDFQLETGPPFFILSLKAGGVGLNLTAASHVIHFDRWWNPAVENQATDRAFRLGQQKNVLVHKFICQGTVEEKIDLMIDTKRSLADDVLAGGGEVAITEMSNDQIMKFVSLDLKAAALKE